MDACVLATNGERWLFLMQVFVAVGWRSQKWKQPVERCCGEGKERGG